MTGEELRRRYAAGEKDFAGLDLSGVNISGIDPDLDLAAYDELCPDFAADFSGINLSQANLTNAILIGASLDRCNLTDVDFSGSNLTRAYLSGAEFQGTIMRRVDFLYADISETHFFAADVAGAKNINTIDFSGTPVYLVLDDGTVIDEDHDW